MNGQSRPDVPRAEAILAFKRLFEAQKRALIYTNAVVNTDFQLSQDDLMDEVDLSTTELETSMRMRLRNREALFVKKIDESLQRIEAGTFGICQDCGDEIELKRLQARPTAELCVGCKEESERSERVHIDGHRSKSLGKSLRMA